MPVSPSAPQAAHPTSSAAVPRPEHPRPQFVREAWLTLNGTWQFELDPGDSGLERGLRGRELTGAITVPFAPESAASGVGNADFLHAVWYRRTVVVPLEWAGGRTLLHFGAVDHDATVWVNDQEVARHRGGFTSFTADLTDVVTPGEEAVVVVRARDTPRDPQARGKQSTWYGNSACFYPRTTGIWQSVWLEAVPHAHITSAHLVPQLADSSLTVTAEVSRHARGLTFEAVLADAEGEVTRARVPVGGMAPSVRLAIPRDRLRTWSPADPHLYDLSLRLLGSEAPDGEAPDGEAPDGELVPDGETPDGERVVDELASYAGLREIAIDGDRVLLNGEPVFQRLVLDQGYWPDTLMTAPSDEALRRDIELGMAAGFNGARLHQKVFEERYLYHADRLGYLVWGEFGDWGVNGGAPGENQRPTASFITQWVEAVRRDRSHPAIIGWCPLNETYQALHDRITQLDDVTHGMYLATKAADPTRPVLDASGYAHRVRGADVYDSHDYEQDPETFRRHQSGLTDGRPWINELEGEVMSLPFAGQPFFLSEYGGIWWNAELAGQVQRESSDDPARADSWGYGDRVMSIGEWYARYEGLTRVLLEDPVMFGYCYTQLTDTFQEQNGLYDAERRPKVDIARVRAIQQSPAAYESVPPKPAPPGTARTTAQAAPASGSGE